MGNKNSKRSMAYLEHTKEAVNNNKCDKKAFNQVSDSASYEVNYFDASRKAHDVHALVADKLKVYPMQKDLENYINNFLSIAKEYFEYGFDCKAVVFEDSTLLSFTQNKNILESHSPQILLKNSFQEACKEVQLDLNNFLPEEQQGNLIPASDTIYLYQDNTFFLLKNNNSNSFSEMTLKEDIRNVIAGLFVPSE